MSRSSESEKDKEGEYSEREYSYNINNSNNIINMSPPNTPGTATLSKSARNRIYAQTSRARHRAYVTNLERDRELLMERLERIEEENREMRRELNELRVGNKRTRVEHSSDPQIQNFKNQIQQKQSQILKTSNNNFVNDQNQNDFSAQYALSVLDFMFPITNPTFMTNSPWPLVPLFNFLVAVTKDSGREIQMNWKGNCCSVKNQKKMKILRRKMNLNLEKTSFIHQSFRNQIISQHQRSKLLEIIKLVKLKIYLQQYGNK